MHFGALTVVFMVIPMVIPYALLVRYGKKQSPQAYTGIIGALVVVFGIADVFRPPQSGSQRDACWAHTPVNVRSGRSTSDPIATGLERGERIEVDSLVDGWFRVFRNGQPIGYSASSVLNEGPPSSEASIPEYVVADRVGNYGDIVVPSLSLSAPREELATVANAIGVREGLDALSLYCSQDAVRANFSQSFLEANPRAYDCVLGSWEDGVFTLTPR